MNTVTQALATAGMIGVMMSSVGCASAPRPWRGDLRITPDATLRDGSGRMPQVEVDLLAINETDDQVRSYPVADWFAGENLQRKVAASYTKSVSFGPGNDQPVVIASNDPIWDVWAKRGYKDLLVFASARTMRAMPASDGRRKTIPLTNDKWDVRQIDLRVTGSGVELATPMKIVK